MKKIASLIFSLSIVGIVSCSSSITPDIVIERKHSGETATNPLAPNLSLFDPTIIKGDDGYYYSYFVEATNDYDGDGTSEKSLAPIFRSSDMVSWTYVGSVFENESDAKWDGASELSIWSPEIAYINGKYVYYYSLGMMGFVGDTRLDGVGVAYSITPYGPWTYGGKLLDGFMVNNWDPIDPSIVVDGDKVYMYYGNFDGIYYIELTSDGLQMKNSTPVLVAGEHNDTNKLVDGHSPLTDCDDYSAPCVRKIDDAWYLFASTGAWHKEYAKNGGYKYHTVVFKSNKATGPFKDSSGKSALIQGSGDVVCDSSEEFLNPGCAHIIEDEGNNYYIYCQAYDKSVNNNRLLVMDQLIVDDGYPHTKDKIINTTFEKPYIDK